MFLAVFPHQVVGAGRIRSGAVVAQAAADRARRTTNRRIVWRVIGSLPGEDLSGEEGLDFDYRLAISGIIAPP
jgi:hypothetical protein